MKKTKEEKEKYYFDKFCMAQGFSWEVVEQCKPPKPDFIGDDCRKIGIEITNYSIVDGGEASSEMKQSPQRQRIANLAHKMFLEDGGGQINVALGFNLIIERSKEEIARDIFHFVRDNQSLTNDRLTFYARMAIPEIAFLYISSAEHSPAEWRLAQVHDVTTINIERLTEIIKGKEGKNYTGCDAYWLLIVMDMMDPGQEQEIPRSELPKIPSQKFEKIFFYKTGYEQVFTL